MKKIWIVSLSALALIACRKTEFADVERTNGEADFTTYIAVGNSLTQGFQDGGVYEEGQKNSYPSIIAAQMKLVQPDMGPFRQPEVYGNGSGYMHLEWQNGEIVVVQPGDQGGFAEDASWADWSPTGVKYNNLGISGITLVQTVALDNSQDIVNNAILGGINISFPPINFDGNPYSRFLDFGDSPFLGGTSKSYLDNVKESNATFFTCWLGNNDVLGYATSGGVVTGVDLTLFGIGNLEIGALSDPNEFRQKYDSVMTAFSNLGAKGVVATIPDVTVIPYFNTFTVQSIIEEYGYANVWIEDYNNNVRIATEADLILLTASSAIENGAGSSETDFLSNGDVLDAYEVNLCVSRTIELNNAIKASAAQFNYPVVDMFTILNTLKPGVAYEGINISPEYIAGGAFSLDGIHLNPRGYAIVANEFIKVINANYGSNIPTVSLGNYRGVVFP